MTSVACSDSSSMGSTKIEAPSGPPRLVLDRSTGHLKLNREHLCILRDGWDPFFPLTAVETCHGKHSMGTWLGQFMKTAGVPSSASLGGHPPGSNSMWDALIRLVGGVSSGDYGG
jgi:hypothetical protein